MFPRDSASLLGGHGNLGVMHCIAGVMHCTVGAHCSRVTGSLQWGWITACRGLCMTLVALQRDGVLEQKHPAGVEGRLHMSLHGGVTW